MGSVPARATKERKYLSDFEHGVIEVFVNLAELLGVPKSVGEIYGLLFASARALTFQDVIDRLELSKGSASQGLRLLRNIGAVKLVYVSGERRDYFVPETELRALLGGFLREKVRPHFESGLARIDLLGGLSQEVAFRELPPEDGRLLRQRLDKMRAWHCKARALAPIFARLFG